MRLRWLGWAGVEIEADGASLLIDPLGDPTAVYSWAGEQAQRALLPTVVAPQRRGVAAVLLTHLHRDHADAVVARESLATGAPVLRPVAGDGGDLEEVGLAHAEWELERSQLPQVEVANWETVELGPFSCAAVPACDGAGDPQVSWVVKAEGKTVLHCGDTLFHGYWWRIALRLGPIDVAWLPISGATNDFPNRQPPSPFPAVMGPEQAAVAAELVQAERAIPMHFGGFDFAPHYVPTHDCLDRFLAAAADRPVEPVVLAPGDCLSLEHA